MFSAQAQVKTYEEPYVQNITQVYKEKKINESGPKVGVFYVF